MKVTITAKPALLIIMNKERIEALIDMSKHHYDGICKKASKVGGFLYGFQNRVLFGEEPTVECEASWYECDIMCKIMENSSILSFEQSKMIGELFVEIRQALEFARVNVCPLTWEV